MVLFIKSLGVAISEVSDCGRALLTDCILYCHIGQ